MNNSEQTIDQEMPASAPAAEQSNQSCPFQNGDTVTPLLEQLDAANKAAIEVYIKRALARQEEGLPISPLALAHDGLKLDVDVGKQVMNNILFSDRPAINQGDDNNILITLPEPSEQPTEKFEQLMRRRTSVRDYTDEAVSLAEISSLCASTVSARDRFKTTSSQVIPHAPLAPTGGGLLSIQLYYISLNTESLSRGIYKYRADKHGLELVSEGEIRGRIFEITSFQDWIARCAGIFVLVSDLDRVQWKYEDRAYRLTHMDAGVLGQSLHLAATSIDLGSCMVFGFLDDEMNQLMSIDGDRQFVSLIMPIGKPIPDYSSL